MKKIIATIAMCALSSSAIADFLTGTDNRCFIDTSGWNESWFCGKSDDKCADKKATGGYRNPHYLYHGEYFTKDSTRYYCCNGTTDEIGRFVKASSFNKTETITVQLDGGGKCNYSRKTDICGNIIKDEKCTTPDKCPAQTILRNGQCVTPCIDGYVFESATLNRCIECPDSQTQGIQGIGYDKKCIRCKSTEILNKDTWKCEDPEAQKKQLQKDVATGKKIAISRGIMEQCWQCPDSNLYKDCVKSLAKQQELSDAIKTKCKISE
ncbi:MAG: hypothetical protein IJ500_04075 [Alphaproteobacteria bacterium]|nr:hypothetical protein [Alphaproteobacteria bacterium]